MTPYLIGGLCVLVTVFLTAWLTFAYRAGRNSARVRSENQEASDASQQATQSQNMLTVRTNGLRSNDILSNRLKKGDF